MKVWNYGNVKFQVVYSFVYFNSFIYILAPFLWLVTLKGKGHLKSRNHKKRSHSNFCDWKVIKFVILWHYCDKMSYKGSPILINNMAPFFPLQQDKICPLLDLTLVISNSEVRSLIWFLSLSCSSHTLFNFISSSTYKEEELEKRINTTTLLNSIHAVMWGGRGGRRCRVY